MPEDNFSINLKTESYNFLLEDYKQTREMNKQEFSLSSKSTDQ